MPILADRIRAIREAAGDTIAVAAHKVGITRQGYTKLESSETANMQLAHLKKFCDAYSVAIEALLRDEELLYETAPTTAMFLANSKTADEGELLDGYRRADSGTREDLLTIARRARRDADPENAD